MLTRFEDWPSRLANFIDRRRVLRFRWGKNDCALFASDGVLEMTGVDLASEFRGKYSDREGAYAAMEEFAGGGVVEVAEQIAAQYQIREVSKMFACRGDVMLGKLLVPDTLEISAALGLSIGEHSAFMSPTGMVTIPTIMCERAWKI